MNLSNFNKKSAETSLYRYLGFWFVACVIMLPVMGWAPMLSLAVAGVMLFAFYNGMTGKTETKPPTKTKPKQNCRRQPKRGRR